MDSFARTLPFWQYASLIPVLIWH